MSNINQVHRSLGELVGEVRGLKEAVNKLAATSEKRLDDHGQRIKSLENSRTRLRTLLGVGALGGTGSLTWDSIVNSFRGMFHG